MINRTGLGIACALSAAVMYGLVPNAVRGAFNHGVPPIETTFFRTSFVAICFALATVWQGGTLRVPPAAWRSFTAQAVATLGVSVGYLASIQFIPVGLAAIVFFTFPVIILLVAPLAEGHAPGIFRLAVALVAFLGLAIAIGPGFESLDIRGLALAMGASISCVLQFFSGRAISAHMRPQVFGALVHLAIWPFVLAIVLVAGSGTIRMFPGGSATEAGLFFMLAVGVLYVAAYMVHMSALRFAPASAVAPYFNLEPIIATLVAAAFLGERLTLSQYLGGAMVLGALAAPGILAARGIKAP